MLLDFTGRLPVHHILLALLKRVTPINIAKVLNRDNLIYFLINVPILSLTTNYFQCFSEMFSIAPLNKSNAFTRISALQKLSA